MQTEIWYPPVSSVEGCFGKGAVASASTFAWPKAAPISYPDARLFSSSQYVSGSLQAAARVLELRGSDQKNSEQSPFKRNCLGFQ